MPEQYLTDAVTGKPVRLAASVRSEWVELVVFHDLRAVKVRLSRADAVTFAELFSGVARLEAPNDPATDVALCCCGRHLPVSDPLHFCPHERATVPAQMCVACKSKRGA